MIKRLLLQIKKQLMRAAVVVLVISIVCNLGFLLLNQLPNNNRLFSRMATHWLQQPVQIQQVKITGFLYRPVFTFHTMRLGQIQLQSFQVRLNFWRSVWERRWIAEQVVIDHLQLHIQSDQAHQLQITGLTLDDTALSQQTALLKQIALWVSTQSEIQFSHAEIHFSDAEKHVFFTPNLNLIIQNQGERHVISADFTLANPDRKAPASFHLVSHLIGNPLDDDRAKASIYVTAHQLDLSSWLSSEKIQGLLNMRLWMDYAHQHIERVQSDFALQNAVKDSIEIPLLSADVTWSNKKAPWELSSHIHTMRVAKNNFFPGISDVSGEVRMTATRGVAEWQGKNVSIDFPKAWALPALQSHLFTTLHWEKENDQWHVSIDPLKLDGAVLHVYAQLQSILHLLKKPHLSVNGFVSLNKNMIQLQHVEIPDLSRPVLHLQAQMKTDFSEVLPLLQTTSIKASGPLVCDMRVKWPFFSTKNDFSVMGQIHFLEDDVQFLKWQLPLTQVNGVAEFNDNTFHISNLKANLFHMPLSISLQAKRQWDTLSDLHIALQGAINPAYLADPMHISFLKQINQRIPFHLKLMMQNLTSTNFTNAHMSLGKFYFFNQWWNNLALEITPLQDGALLQLQGDAIKGNVFFPDKKTVPIRVRIQELLLMPNQKSASVENKLSINPIGIPPLDVSIDHLQVNDRLDGYFRLLTHPIPKGISIRELKMVSPLFHLSATGSWTADHSQTDTLMMGRIQSRDLGAVLAQRHLSSRLKGGDFSSDFSLTWPGSPQQFSMTDSVGKVTLWLKKGRILHLDSGTESNLALGKILNIVSLDSLSHLFKLDFSAWTKKGFPFDWLQANVELSHGQLFAEKVDMDGPVAKIHFQGKMSLANQSNDLIMSVTPKVSVGLPSLLGFVGGPVVGVAAWVADKLMSPAMGQMMQMHYHVGGTWDKPNVKKL